MNSQGMSEEEKREEIETDLSRNMFVEAGAGAGKTTLIVRRIVNMLKSDYEPSEIVAITFTNKAAEELRGRIQKEVEAACGTDNRLTDKLYRLDEMNISTIHSFCNVLLKEQGEAAGLPQDLKLIQGDEEKKLKKRYLNDYLRTLSPTDWQTIEADKDKDWIEDRRLIREYIEELFMSICDLPSEVDIITPKKPINVDALKKSIELFIKGDPSASQPDLAALIVSYAAKCFNDEKNVGDKKETISTPDELLKAAGCKLASDKTVKIINEIKKGNSCDINVVLRELTTGKQTYLKTTGLPVIYDKSFVEEANDLLKGEIEEVLEPAGIWIELGGTKTKDQFGNEIALSYIEALENGVRMERHFQTLVSYAKKARDHYHKNRPVNLITNDNLLELTRNLIKDSKASRDFFRRKYRTFFVDEFQDTDSLQADFIFRLACDPQDESRLRPGALFVVGDPKQSIYRFRGAEPEVYFRIKDKMEGLDNAKTYELSKNFRSIDTIIDWVNQKFDESDKYYHIVNTVTNGSSYSYKYMEAVNKAAPNSNGILVSGVYRYNNPDNERSTDGGNTYSYSECDTETDVENLIKVITELTSKDENEKARYEITRYKQNGDSYEPVPDGIKLSDFLLISPDTTNMDLYVTALKEHGIPVVLDGKISLGRDKALNVYARIYKYLVNPRSPFYRIGAIEAIRESVDMDGEEEVAKYSDEILDCLYDDCRHMTPYGKAQYLERQVSVIFDKDTDIAVVDTHTVSTHIRQMLESINVNINGTGADIIEEMDRYIETKLEHEMSLEESPDAVRFMNLHKAKGLEGNIVILLDRYGRKEEKPVKMRIGNEFYPGVKPKYGKSWSSVSKLKDYEDKYVKDEGSEFHRLEYVALTRAKQAAIFLDVISDGKRYMRRLFAHGKIDRKTSKLDKSSYSYDIKKCKTILNTSVVHMPERPELDVRDYKVGNDEYPSVREEKAMEPVSYIKINPSGLEKGTSHSKKKAVDEAKAAGKHREDEQSSTLKRPIGNLLGDALHNAMELIINGLMQKQTDKDKLVNYCSCRAVMNLTRSLEIEGEFVERDVYQKFIAACGRAYIDWLTDRSQGDSVLDKVETAYTELPFSYGIKKDGRTEWHNGSADLILKNTDGTFTLIDYKSDNDYLVPEEVMDISFKEKYEPQLNEYRNVIMKLFGAEPDKIQTGIISFSQKDKAGNLLEGEKIRIRYTPV